MGAVDCGSSEKRARGRGKAGDGRRGVRDGGAQELPLQWVWRGKWKFSSEPDCKDGGPL